MAVVVVKTFGDLDECINQVEDMIERSDDFRPVFREMREDLSSEWQRNFQTNGSLVGGWSPLDKEYGTWKSVNFPGAPPMVRSGKLFRSLTELRGKPNEINKNRAQFGTNLEYAKFHQYGTTKMPQRKLVFEPRGFAQKWGESLPKFIITGDTEEG